MFLFHPCFNDNSDNNGNDIDNNINENDVYIMVIMITMIAIVNIMEATMIIMKIVMIIVIMMIIKHFTLIHGWFLDLDFRSYIKFRCFFGCLQQLAIILLHMLKFRV